MNISDRSSLLRAPGALCFAIACAAGHAQTTIRMSVSDTGAQATIKAIYGTAMSADGRRVAFWTTEKNLVPGDTNSFADVFVRDRVTGHLSRVSVSSSGAPGTSHSGYPVLSSDGSVVAFESLATNFVLPPPDYERQIYARNLQTGQTRIASVSSTGGPGNNWSTMPALSANGRFVGFASYSNNLVPLDRNGTIDVFLHDTATGQTRRISAPDHSSGAFPDPESNNASYLPSVSGDGSLVAFASEANNLVRRDRNNRADVFVRDPVRQTTTCISREFLFGQTANGHSYSPGISADGRYVAFVSEAGNLVPNDSNGLADVFIHDLQTSSTRLASLSSTGAQANAASNFTSISPDGRYVCFTSTATNLVPGHPSTRSDLYRRDTLTGQTTLISLTNTGLQADGATGTGAIGNRGACVAFASVATNLVANDTNGLQDLFFRALCPGDTNCDGVTDFTDLNNVLATFGQTGIGLPADVNGDGIVSFADLNLVLNSFGGPC